LDPLMTNLLRNLERKFSFANKGTSYVWVYGAVRYNECGKYIPMSYTWCYTSTSPVHFHVVVLN
jgi:hypothetical protein